VRHGLVSLSPHPINLGALYLNKSIKKHCVAESLPGRIETGEQHASDDSGPRYWLEGIVESVEVLAGLLTSVAGSRPP
jgi:hypothetical protein